MRGRQGELEQTGKPRDRIRLDKGSGGREWKERGDSYLELVSRSGTCTGQGLQLVRGEGVIR